MDNIVIHAENLGKMYYLGERQKGYKTIRETIVAAVNSSFRRSESNNGDRPNNSTIWALRNVSFEVKQGEALGIIGHNGAGKSTLLKILSRITRPTEGRVKFSGRIGSLLEVGTGFHQELTGRENIFLNGAIIGMKSVEIRRKFDEIVAFAEIEKFLDTPVKRYSSGMYVRLAFAVAAHLDPEILLVDEVLAVGDAAFQKKCLGKMGDVARGGRTVLFVSHNMGVINQLCGRAIWLDNGRLVEMGDTREVIQNYLNISATVNGVWSNSQVYGAEPKIKLISASVKSSEDDPISIVKFEEDFSLEIYYEVITPVRDWFLLVRITDSSGTPIFTSLDVDSVDRDGTTDIGQYRAICRIPAKLLRPGIYSVTLISRERKVGTLDIHEQAFQFEISTVGYTLNRRRQGIITPVLNWSVERVRD